MITRRHFGKLPNGHEVYAFDLVSDTGLRATVLEYGATLQAFVLPDGLDVVLGFNDLESYLGPHPCFGAAIGRTAGRTRGASYQHGGETISIPANAGAHNLHGGPEGFDRVLWAGKIEDERLVLTHISSDGHQGFAGRVTAQMIFSLDGNTLSLDMIARTDKVTPINLTHHSYFNLTDGGATPALDHDLTVLSDSYLELDSEQIATGRILDVTDSPYDYRAAAAVSPALDHCFVMHHDTQNTSVKKLAKLVSKTTGNMMIICSTQPAVQIYSAGTMGSHIGKGGTVYDDNHGIALEPQNFPNAVNEKSFPSPLLEPKKLYHQTIRYTLKAGNP